MQEAHKIVASVNSIEHIHFTCTRNGPGITFEDNFPAASQFLPPLLHIAGANGIKTYLYEFYMHLNHF
jgi:hypothetical protein